ncbi:MAG: Sec-independent protein translocase protein TatB [Actinomycetota bacterium]|nr:Sec-independent protein translocase protein TatB [Actinomycetota bacterium]
MFNIGGGELLVIFLVILIFIGPTKLPEVARAMGKITSSVRQMSTSFQDEMKRSFDEPIEELAREKGHALIEVADKDKNGESPKTANLDGNENK